MFNLTFRTNEALIRFLLTFHYTDYYETLYNILKPGLNRIFLFQSVFRKLLNFEAEEKEKQKKKSNEVKIAKKVEHVMISATTSMLESIFMVTFFMFKDDRKYMNDYR